MLATGPTKASILTHANLQIDLRSIAPEEYGSALLYFTGSKEHNIAPSACAVSAARAGCPARRDLYPREVEATARAYKTTATIFPHMAHDMMLEAGWQDVADAILAWLGQRGI